MWPKLTVHVLLSVCANEPRKMPITTLPPNHVRRRLLLPLSARSDSHGGTNAHGHSEQHVKSIWRWSPTKLAPRRHARAGAHAATAANDDAATAAADAPSHNNYGCTASLTHDSDSASVTITGASPAIRSRAAASATATCFFIHRASTVAVRITIQIQGAGQGI